MRVQSVIGNTALVLEAEMFGQPSLRARWQKEHGCRPDTIRGLAVEEQVTRMREALLPRAERFSRMAQDAVDGLRRQRKEPSFEVEAARPWQIRLAPLEREARPLVAHSPDATVPRFSRLDEDTADQVSLGATVGK